MMDDSALKTKVKGVLQNRLIEFVNTAIESRKESDQQRWLCDSGASSHYVKDLSRFNSYTWLDNHMEIKTGSGTVWGLAIGDVILNLQIEKVILKNVLLVPDLAVDSDLLSVSALMDAGLSTL